MKRLRTAVLAAVPLVCALLAGCSAVGVRVAEHPGGPVGISVAKTKGGQGATAGPTSAPVPEGFTEVELSFKCPITATMLIPDTFTGNDGPEDFLVLLDPNEIDRDAAVTVSCERDLSTSTVEGRDAEAEYLTFEDDSEVMLSNKYEAENGSVVIYQLKLAKGEPYATDQDMLMYGMSYFTYSGGLLYSVSVKANAPYTDKESAQTHQTILENITVNGEHIKPLDWKDV